MSSSHLAREVATQPADWARAAERAPDLRHILPQEGERVATIGCGTSWFMGQAYASLRESAGQGVTDAWSASDHRLARGYDRAIVICRSGTTTEVCSVIDDLHSSGTPFVSFVATPGTPVADGSTDLVLMDDVDEQSVVQTRFATTTLALLRASLGEDLSTAIDQANAVLAEDEDSALAGLLDVDQVTFLGTGWTVGVAHEAALKLRESAQFWAESYPAMEYRHGPISIATTGRAVWAFGAVPDELEQQVRATGAHWEHREADAMAELVRLHRLCMARARNAGLDPDAPRHLTRSIVLA